jgi:hypothetical protein
MTTLLYLVTKDMTAARRYADRWYRPVMFGLSVPLLVIAGIIGYLRFGAFDSHGYLAVDYRLFLALGQRWAATGSTYDTFQLAGPYAHDAGVGTSLLPSLYPPLAGPVFWLLNFMPAVLWWAVPIAVIGITVARAKPWTWPLMSAVACLPQFPSLFIVGGSSMWVAAGICLAGRLGWPALAVAIKPTLLPFAILGIRHRAFWIGAAFLGVVSLLMLPEWFRYATVVQNMRGPGIVYSLGDAPMLVVLALAAWSADHQSPGSLT